MSNEPIKSQISVSLSRLKKLGLLPPISDCPDELQEKTEDSLETKKQKRIKRRPWFLEQLLIR